MTAKVRTRSKPKKKATDPKLVAFCEAYLRTFNASEAYRSTHPGAQANTSWTEGHRTLRKPEVEAYISKRLKKMVMGADEVLARLTRYASGSMRPFMDVKEDGFAGINLSTDEAKIHLDLIKEIQTSRTRRVVGRGERQEEWEDEQVKVKIPDPLDALKTLGKYHNLFTEKDEDGNPITDEERIARVMAILDDARARRDGQTPAGN
jgi:phage terminase small subunit